MIRSSRVLVFLVGVLALGACSKSSGPGDSTPSTITITGDVTHKYLGCAFNASAKLDDLQVSVFDQSGTLIATTHTGSETGTCEKTPGGTIVRNAYSVAVPSESFYKLQVDAVPTDDTLSSADTCSARSISASDLQAAGYVVDLNSGTTRPDLLTGDPGQTC